MNGLLEPVPIIVNVEFHQFTECFRLTTCANGYELRIKVHDKWHSLYRFSMFAYLESDFESFNFYLPQIDQSVLVKSRICSICNQYGSIMLDNLQLNIRKNRKITSVIITEDNYLQTLDEYFGIRLPHSITFKLIAKRQ